MRNPDYNTDIAKAVLARIIDRLAAGAATTTELIAASGKSPGRGRDYLMRLRTTGQVLCVVEPVHSFNGATPGVWGLNPDYVPALDVPFEVDDTVDTFPRRVIVRRSGEWAPHHARGPMECLLFGVPKILQGTHA